MMVLNIQYFGSRGASIGINFETDMPYGKQYGDEYRTLGQTGNIKIVEKKSGSNTAPKETKTKGRVYATIDVKGDIKCITFYDKEGLLYKQIDLKGKPHNGIKPPHVHLGYEHSEDGFREPNDKEKEIIKKVHNYWKRRRKAVGK